MWFLVPIFDVPGPLVEPLEIGAPVLATLTPQSNGSYLYLAYSNYICIP